MRYLGNTNHQRVHDLWNEQVTCYLGLILDEHRVDFDPDTLEQAENQGFDPCDECLDGS